MSKYYKAEDVIRAIAEQLCWEARTEYGDKFTTEDWLEEAGDYVSDLPTIEVSEDAISREWLCTVFGLSEKTRKWGGDHSGYDTKMLYEIQNYIEQAPSVVPSRAEGEWIKQGQGRYRRCVCSVCGHGNGRKYNDNFCSNCGAKMKGESK